jgi:hypothetical protein
VTGEQPSIPTGGTPAGQQTQFRVVAGTGSALYFRAALPVMCFLIMLGCSRSADNGTSLKHISDPAPKMVLETHHVDLGTVIAGTSVQQSIGFHNTGDADLVITRAMGAGPGMTVDYPRKPLKPGKTGILSVRLNTRHYEDAHDRRVVIISNDPQAPRQYIVFSMELDVLLGIRPLRVRLGNVSGLKPVQASFDIIGSRIDDLSIDRIRMEFGDTDLRAEYILQDARNQSPPSITANVAFRLQGRSPGLFRIPVTVHTGMHEYPILETVLVGTLTGPYTAEPGRIYFRQTLSGAASRQSLTLRREDGRPFHIISADVDGDGFRVPDVPAGEAVSHSLTLEYTPADGSSGRHQAILKIRTDASDYPYCQIPVYVFSGPDCVK